MCVAEGGVAVGGGSGSCWSGGLGSGGEGNRESEGGKRRSYPRGSGSLDSSEQ